MASGSAFESDSSSTQNRHNKSESADVDEYIPEPFEGNDLELDAKQNDAGENAADLSRHMSNAVASREISRKLTGGEKLLEKANNTNEPMPVMGGGRDYPPPIGDREIYSVTFDGPKDPEHPHNWPLKTKLILCWCVAILALSASVGSAIFAEAGADVKKVFHVGREVATLGTSLYVFGFASGPVVWGPLSELYGRFTVMIPACFIFACFSFACATGKDIQTILLCRFFSGFFGAAPMVVAPASLADLFSAGSRGKALAVFASVLFGGPMLGPIFGGFTVKNSLLGWRWCEYFTGLVGILALLFSIPLHKETHHPLILVSKAENLRRRTGNWAIHAPHEEFVLSINEIVTKNIARPMVMLFTEPILFFITLYNAFIYGLLYLMLTAIPMVFEGQYGWKVGEAQLPYLSMLIGILIGVVICIYFEGKFNANMIANGKACPEDRLPPMMIGGVLFAIGLFWFGWTGNYPDKIHWIVPTISLAFIGCGLLAIFLPCINYIVDCYLMFAASALSGNTFLRSLFGGIFPLFSVQMFEAMHIRYAGTLLGCVALILVPVPFLFYYKGSSLRKRSKYTISDIQ
ncbi:polyamine transporter 1 [[Candida] railenensis]|uniref:Polyamine transporter 1 n=1 Tax=[Candida] railenensis TaxID=45579 RepID=A0A9P0VYC4_9ASCO|nr:polyamine transporter 1 [[Candida] railenensis]